MKTQDKSSLSSPIRFHLFINKERDDSSLTRVHQRKQSTQRERVNEEDRWEDDFSWRRKVKKNLGKKVKFQNSSYEKTVSFKKLDGKRR